MVNLMDYAATTGNTFWLVFQFIFVLVLILAIFWFVYIYFFAYNIRFRVREVLDGNTRIIDDKAREIKDKEGVTKLKLFKRKHNVQLPPQKAYHITDKGKYCLEAYYLHEGEYKYVVDEGCDTTSLTNFKPLDTADREFYASEMREAESYKKKGWAEYLPIIAAVGTPLIVLILVFAFWGDISESTVKVAQQNAEVSKANAETTSYLRDIIQDRQKITNIDKPLKDDSKDLTEDK